MRPYVREGLPYIAGITAGFAGYKALTLALFPHQGPWLHRLLSIVAVFLLSTAFTLWFQRSLHTQLARSVKLSEQLQQREEYYRALSEHAMDLVVIVNADGTYRYISPSHESMLGFKPDELRGRTGIDQVHPDDRARLLAAFAQLIEEHAPSVTITYRQRHADGSWRVMESIANNRIDDPVIRGILINSRDISERKQAEDAIAQLNEELEARVAERTARLQETEDALHRLIGKILQLQDAERQRIAHDLHEETAQNVSAMRMAIARLQQVRPDLDATAQTLVSEGLSCAEQALKEIRMLSYILHPPLLDQLGLRPALEWYVDEFVRRSRIRVELTIAPDIGRLPPDTETTVFRVVQEGLSNLLQHSGSTTASIRLAREPDKIVLRVQDQGSGLPAGALTEVDDAGHSPGVGIPGMRERLRRLGGRLDISSSAHGTTLTANLPHLDDAAHPLPDSRGRGATPLTG
jgi:PAS domain S-box-containing protein